MFTFFRKKHIYFYNKLPGLADNFPICNISELNYSWKAPLKDILLNNNCKYKQLTNSTLFCSGINNITTKGFILRNFVDIHFKKNYNGGVLASIDTNIPKRFSKQNIISSFELKKYFSNLKFSSETLDVIGFKLDTFWRVHTNDPDTLFILNQVPYYDDNNIIVLPGILDIKQANQINVFFIIKNINEDFILKAGTPLYHILPISKKTLNKTFDIIQPNTFTDYIDSKIDFKNFCKF